jgi:hypothetical protein
MMDLLLIEFLRRCFNCPDGANLRSETADHLAVLVLQSCELPQTPQPKAHTEVGYESLA